MIFIQTYCDLVGFIIFLDEILCSPKTHELPESTEDSELQISLLLFLKCGDKGSVCCHPVYRVLVLKHDRLTLYPLSSSSDLWLLPFTLV